jgi:hypothetical protein
VSDWFRDRHEELAREELLSPSSEESPIVFPYCLACNFRRTSMRISFFAMSFPEYFIDYFYFEAERALFSMCLMVKLSESCIDWDDTLL